MSDESAGDRRGPRGLWADVLRRAFATSAALSAAITAHPAAAQPAEPPPGEGAGDAPPPAVVVAPAPPDQAPGADAGVAVVPLPPALDPAAGEPPSSFDTITPPYFPINLSLLHPLATNANAPDLWTHLDLALLLGRVGFVDGAQVGLFTWIEHQLRGLQIGVATVAGRVEGAQVAGAFSFSDAPFHGIQLAGVFGWASQSVTGIQVSGVANQTYGDFDGIQGAGVVNIARRLVTGVQAAGGVNIGRVDGLQIGPINVSQEQRGVQIGILNIARNIDGLQIGVINITDNLRGESLGIIPLPREGGIHPVFWGSNSLLGNVGVKMASHYAYTILSGSFHGEASADGQGRESLIGVGLTMGARLPWEYEGLWGTADLGGYRAFRVEGATTRRDEVYKARVILAYSLVPRLSPFLGAGVHLKVRGDDQVALRWGPEICAGLEM